MSNLKTLCVVASVSLLSVQVPFAQAATRSWDANGAGPPNGAFNVPANWNPNTVPAAGDEVTFSLTSTYTVTFPTNAASDSATRG